MGGGSGGNRVACFTGENVLNALLTIDFSMSSSRVLFCLFTRENTTTRAVTWCGSIADRGTNISKCLLMVFSACDTVRLFFVSASRCLPAGCFPKISCQDYTLSSRVFCFFAGNTLWRTFLMK